MKFYNIPKLSAIGWHIAIHLPHWVTGWIYIAALDELDHGAYESLHVLEENGESWFDAVSAHRIENIRRHYYHDYLKAKTDE